MIYVRASYSPEYDGNVLKVFRALLMKTSVLKSGGLKSFMSIENLLLHSKLDIGVEFSKLV